ncbi:MAG TPA: tetratricopeptide repeat protein [Elusimicrobiota bacterium]|nr:tetratricopeptide repeat protein [Elusimicrobiota bacterium]
MNEMIGRRPVDGSWPFRRWRRTVPAAALLLLTLAAYGPAYRAGFVWDDDNFVMQNASLRTGEGLRRIWTEYGAVPQAYPLLYTAFWVQHKLWGFSPAGYHVVNVALHGANAVLAWNVLAALSVPWAWWAAALFAVHPVHAESVAWVTELKNVLSGFFYLGAFLCYLKFEKSRQGAPPGRGRGSCYAAALGLFLCALMSKSVTASFPAAMALTIWWQRGRLRWREVSPLAPFLALGVLAGFLSSTMERRFVGAMGGEWDLAFLERILIAGRALWFYAGKLAWPSGLTFIYPRWTIEMTAWGHVLFPAAVIAVFAALWIQRQKIGRGPLAAVLFFAGTLAPALGFFDFYPMRFSFVADHFQYLASLGLLGLGAGVVGSRIKKGKIAVPVAAALLLVLAGRTWTETGKFRDAETLWRDTLQKNPQSWLAHNNLGNLLVAENRIPAAIRSFRRALILRPGYPEARYNLGLAYFKKGEYEKALEQYDALLRLRPRFAAGYANRANFLWALNRRSEAWRDYETALRLDPGLPEAHLNAANAFAEIGETEKAEAHYVAALNSRSDSAETHYNFAVMLRRAGRAPEAEKHLRAAVALRPDFSAAPAALGSLLLQRGALSESLVHLRRALALDPRREKSWVEAGIVLGRLGDFEGALKHFDAAVRLDPGDAFAQANRGMVLERLGRGRAAEESFKTAVALDPSLGYDKKGAGLRSPANSRRSAGR